MSIKKDYAGASWWSSWNYNNFSWNAYNETVPPQSWCLTKKSPYVNPYTTIKYFSKDCIDPYTGYGFWYRRFADQKAYLNCYNIPYPDTLLQANWGYVERPPAAACKGKYINPKYNVVQGGFHFYE